MKDPEDSSIHHWLKGIFTGDYMEHGWGMQSTFKGIVNEEMP